MKNYRLYCDGLECGIDYTREDAIEKSKLMRKIHPRCKYYCRKVIAHAYSLKLTLGEQNV